MPPDQVQSGSSRQAGAPVALRHIVKNFDNCRAIDDLSLDIEPGEFITFLGPSGSGKSTTLMMIAGFEQPTAGDILIGGSVVTHMPAYRRNIGMVFQNYALFPHLTVAENIGFPLKQRGVAKPEIREHVRRMLDLIQLSGYEARFPQQLSGGQQQRVAIARAIVFNPPVLLMDEPLSALDKQLREGLQLEIKRLHDRLGITFIYVTHDQKEALVMSDRVAVMNEGRIAQIGSPKALYDTPANRFVASFVGEANLLEATIVGKETDGLLVLKIGDVLLRAPASSLSDVERLSLHDQAREDQRRGVQYSRGTASEFHERHRAGNSLHGRNDPLRGGDWRRPACDGQATAPRRNAHPRAGRSRDHRMGDRRYPAGLRRPLPP